MHLVRCPNICGASSQVPATLCNGLRNSSLTDLLLSNNQFSGTFDVPYCDSLVSLDIGVSPEHAWPAGSLRAACHARRRKEKK